MKYPFLFMLTLLASESVMAQQVVDPSQNKPVEVVPQSHSFSYPFGAYPSEINPAYIREWTMEVPINTGTSQTLNTTNAQVKTTYFDGLKRPIQEIKRKASDDYEDVVKLHLYDKLGRRVYEMSPYAKPGNLSDGKFDQSPADGLNNTYNPNPGAPDQQEPFAKNDFDNSPLNKNVKKCNPGQAWVGSNRGITTSYGTNSLWTIQQGTTTVTITGGYPRWTIGPNITDIPQWVGDYALNELTYTSSTDEDGMRSDIFKDKFGKTVFTRRQIQLTTQGTYPTDYAYTCYVYDDFGRLRCVIPPLACKPTGATFYFSWSLDQEKLNNLCYLYLYDDKGRQIEKKLPGKGKELIVYDKWDRIVLTRDGNLSGQDKWHFTIYNMRDNAIMSGLYTSSASRIDLQQILDASLTESAPSLYYYLKTPNLLNSYPSIITNCRLLTKTFYSTYDYPEISGLYFLDNVYPQTALPNFIVPFTPSLRTEGLVTGTLVRVMDPDDPNAEQWLKTINYYNQDGKLLQQHAWNHMGGIDVTSYQYTFKGAVWSKTLLHHNPDATLPPEAEPFLSPDYMKEIKLITTYRANIGYNDHTWQYRLSINDGPAFLVASYEYSPFDRMKIKNLATANVFYDYNLHNNLKSINAYLLEQGSSTRSFSEEVFYESGFASKLYNGNIAGITWQGYGPNAPKRFYGYRYDKLGRLIHAEFGEKIGIAPYAKNINDFTVSNITYDLNGNLKTMNQRGVGGASMSPLNMDVLTYNYASNSNQLINVIDGGDNNTSLPDFKDLANSSEEYAYDGDGNITLDANKGVSSITYNHLNKPEKVTLTGKGIVTFVYDALGNKLQKKIRDDVQSTLTTYDYINVFTYKDKLLQHFITDEGRCRPYFSPGQSGYGYTEPTAINYNYDYYIKDHIGNVRQTLTTESMIRRYVAQHEIATANVEQLVFDNIEFVRDSKPGSTNPEDMMAAHLIAEDPGKRIGTSIFLRVMPEDKFEISADGLYEGGTESTGTVPTEELLGSLISALTGGVTYGGIPVADLPDNARLVTQTLTNPNLPGLLEQIQTTNESPNVPQAYLNYLFFDDKMELVPANSGRIQITEGAGGWNTIAPLNELKPSRPGYLLIYVGNVSIGSPVWFDRITIKHTAGRVTDENHYYPFGLTLSEESGNPSEKNYIKFNSKELHRDEFMAINGNKSGLELYDFGARMLDPQLGRWIGVDMEAEKFFDFTPYAYTSNNPVLFIDPDGNTNMVYLVNLPGSGLKASQIEAIKNEANASLHALGLAIEVKTFNDPASFKFENLSSSDAVVVFGKPKEISGYVSNVLGDKNIGEVLSRWQGGLDNPEESKSTAIGGNHDGAPGGIVAIDGQGLIGFNDYFNSVFSSDNVTETVATTGAFITLHGLGHNAGMEGHSLSYSNAALNFDGNTDKAKYGQEGFKGFKEFMNNTNGKNNDYIKAMKTKFKWKIPMETMQLMDAFNKSMEIFDHPDPNIRLY